MRKKIITSFFILIVLFVVGVGSIIFNFPERTQNFILESLNFKTYLNKKLKKFIATKINNKNINVNKDTINFLEPDWPNIVKLELYNIDIYSLNEDRKSNINFYI